MGFVPEQHTDFIFDAIGEEWGFVGSTLFLLIFCGLLGRLVIMAERQSTVFGRVLGYSLASVLFFHMSINIGMKRKGNKRRKLTRQTHESDDRKLAKSTPH